MNSSIAVADLRRQSITKARTSENAKGFGVLSKQSACCIFRPFVLSCFRDFSKLPVAIALLCLPLGSLAAESKVDVKTLLEKKTFVDPLGHKLHYRLLKPETVEPGKKYPLVIFLHGAGERGEDNTKQLVHGIADFAKPENRKARPCFLIAPQCPEFHRWVEVDWSAPAHTQPANPSEPAALVLDLLAQLTRDLPIDTKRLYLTGLSMGGYGTWDLIARRPELFAAAVPICGGGDEATAPRIAKLPIWVFHGAKDGAVKPERSRNMIAAIEKAGGKPRCTEYPNEGHASWVPAYRDPEMHQWLFAQQRDVEPAVLPTALEREKLAGFVPLFNGKDLTGWKAYDSKPDIWVVENDMLVCKGTGGGWLGTDRDYANFVLRFEYRLIPAGNSGIYLRAPEKGHISRVGMEIQLLDDFHPRYGGIDFYQYTGSIYHVVAPTQRASKKAGAWNAMEIAADGREMRIVLNGKKIIDANLDRALRDPAIAAEHPGLTRTTGRIGLQNHTDRVDFRNLRIKELPASRQR